MNTVILDFDGTIADTKSLIVSTMQQTLSVLGLPARSDEACASMIGLPLRQTFTDLIPMDDETADLCDKTYRELFMQNNKPGIVKLFPHVRETIAELYAMGIIITVASSRGRDTLVSFLDEMGLMMYISKVVSSQDVEQAKPAPDMVYVIMEHSEAEKEDVLMVGDTVFDIDMGKNAGVKTCGVTYGNGKIDELSHADYIINDFAQLLDIV
ncbi:MAG: HAD family hydrolase [Prevotella sp.]|nr:HAD family hydrolase [Prevotella sp.]MDD5895479.1 HAD family hydrolase [Prevotellaceae bacterium]